MPVTLKQLEKENRDLRQAIRKFAEENDRLRAWITGMIFEATKQLEK